MTPWAPCVGRTSARAASFTELLRDPVIIKDVQKRLGQEAVPAGLFENMKFEGQSPLLYQLQVVDSDPVRARNYANAFAESFRKYYGESYTQSAQGVVELIQAQLKTADREMSTAQARLDTYRREHELVTDPDIQVSPVMGRLQQARQKRDELRERLADARARLEAVQRQLGSLPETVAVERSVATSPTVKALEEELAQAEKQLTVTRARYKDEHIQVQQAQALRDALAERLQKEMVTQPKVQERRRNPDRAPLEQMARDLRAEIDGYAAQDRQLALTITNLELEFRRYSGVDGGLNQLTADLSAKAQERASIVARLQAARSAVDLANARNPISRLVLVGPQNPPMDTTQGRTAKLVVLAALCAFVGTSGLLVAFDTVDRRIRTLPEAEMVLPAPVLAAIPQPLGPVTAGILPRAAEQQPLSLHSEAFRFLAVHLLGVRDQGIRSLMVASAKADQGSTVTATNLGISLAQAGQRVILVDANLRTPRLHEIFGADNESGFSSLLRRPDAATLETAIQATSVPNLRVIPSGPGTDNPWELFRSENLVQVAGRLRDLADYVIYDTPSALAFTDALNLTPAVDGALLCVRALEPPSGAEQRLVELLEAADVTVLGSVLNDVPASVLESYQNYQRYYPPAPNGHNAVVAVADEDRPAGPRSWIQTPGGANGSRPEA